ncbi:hypothetical protein MRX96_047512 [Rhipicephalus microplus]
MRRHRLALLQLKYIVARLVQQYRLEPSSANDTSSMCVKAKVGRRLIGKLGKCLLLSAFPLATGGHKSALVAGPSFILPVDATMLVTGALLLLSVLLLATLLIWRRWHFSYFERIGIPGPKPSLIWGNLKEYHSMQYGDIFGFYNGDAPFVVSRDINFVEHIFVRDFQNFVDRGFTMMTDQMHPDLKKSIMHIGGSPWKSIRSSVTYGMSANKLKQMMPHLKEDADIFVKSLEKHADTGEEVHIASQTGGALHGLRGTRIIRH